MKWKNVDRGASYYYITATITEWLPLLARDYIRRAVCYDINVALHRFQASLVAYVIMPEHLHILVYLPEDGLLHAFLKCWRGRSARRIIDLLVARGDRSTLDIPANHANGGSKYTPWKEQARAFAVYTEPTLQQKASYIHANPVRRGLVEEPGQWPYSSFRNHERGEMDVSGFQLD